MTLSAQREILDREIRRLEAEGYDVFVEPRPPVAPPFLKGHIPDLVAIRDGKKLAVEVASPSTSVRRKLAEVAATFRDHPDWEFRLVWVEPTSSSPDVPTQSIHEIRTTISEIERLKGERFYRAAFLLAWAAFEAASRALISKEFARPQTPGRLVNILSREGYLEPADADAMRELAETRNRLVHGVLDAKVGPREVNRLVQVLRSMTEEIVA